MSYSKINKIFSSVLSILTISALLSISVFATDSQKVDLRDEIKKRGIWVRNQGGRGTCVLQSLTFLEEYVLTGRFGNLYNHLSIDYGVQAGNKATGEKDEVSSFTKFYRGYNEYGAIADSKWPYNPNATYDYIRWDATILNFTTKGRFLLQDGYRLAGKCLREGGEGAVTKKQLDEVISYLNRGIPVAQSYKGHSTVIVGYERDSSYSGGGYFLYRNSYGIRFRNQGYGRCTFAEVKAADNNTAFFVFEIASAYPKIYKHSDYKGYGVALAPGKYTLTQLMNIGIEEDSVSSIIIPNGYTAYLYEHNNFGGTVKKITGDVSNLTSIDFNDTLSSIEIVAPMTKVYQNINYGGYKVALAPGKYTLQQLENLGISNDDLSSIKVPSGYTVSLYENDNFAGKVRKLTGNESDFRNLNFNDTVSSILITR